MLVGRANGFVPVAAGMSGCAAGGWPNGEGFKLLGGVAVFWGLAKGLVFCGGETVCCMAPPKGDPVLVGGSMDWRKGFVDAGWSVGERVD